MNRRLYLLKAPKAGVTTTFFLTLLAFVSSFSLNAQTTLYTESMDNNIGGAPSPNTLLDHETNGNFDQVGLTYSGTADMRNNNNSTGYGTASGAFNVMLNSTGETFIIDGLDLTSCLSDVVLSFGVSKSLEASDGSTLNIQYSTSGTTGTFTSVSIPLLPTGAGTGGNATWYYVSTTSEIPSNATTIRFAATDGTQFRIDDILIECNTTTCIPPTFNLNPLSATICEDDDLLLKVDADGTPFTYQWQVDMGAGFVDVTDDATYDGSTNDSLQITAVTAPMDGYIYRCVATSLNGCGIVNSTNAVMTINVVLPPTITAGGPITFCTGGSVILTSSSTVNNLWSDGSSSTTQSIVVTESGEYTVKVNNGTCQKSSAPTTVTVEDPSFSFGIIEHPTLCGTFDGSIELLGTQSGDVTYRTYTAPIIPAVTDPITLPYIINGLAIGDWEITFRTPSGCQSKDSVTLVAGLPVPTISAAFQTLTAAPEYKAEFCQPDSISLISSSDIDNTWQSLSNGVWTDIANTKNIMVLATDTVRVSVTSGACTQISDTAFVLVNRKPIISVSTFSDPSGCGLSDGIVQILGDTLGTLTWLGPVGGSSAVDLDLAPNTFDVTGLSSGAYKFVLSDGTCVSDTVTQSLSDPGAPITPVITPSGPTTFCVGGSVNLTIPATAATLIWYNGTDIVQVNGTTLPVTESGSYSVTADIAGCLSSSTTENVTVHAFPPIPTISSSDANDTICTGTSATLTSSVGVAYMWMPGAMTSQAVTVNTGADYTVAITENGCTSTSAIYTLHETDTTSLVTGTINNPSICGSSDGTIQVLNIKDSDENTDSLSWVGAVSNQVDNITIPYVVTSLSASSYDLTFTTMGGCVALATVLLNDPITVPTIALGTGDTVTFCEGGSVTLVSSSSVGNQWTWNGMPITGATDQVFTTDSSGVYAVTVSIGTCNTPSLDTIVTVIPLPILTSGVMTSPSQCGFADGSIEILGPGTGDLSWTGPSSGSIIGVNLGINHTVTGLLAGTYTFTYDDGTCTSLATDITLNETSTPAIPTITALSSTTFCDDHGTNNVTLVASATSGSYNWSNGVTGTDASGADTIVVNQSSNYSVTVTEGACSVTSDFTTVTVVNNPSAPSIVANGATTFCDGGSVVLTASLANGILWSDGQTTQSVTVVDPTTLSAIVQENGCDSDPSNSISITENPVPVIALGTITDPTTCAGLDGSIQITGTSTGNLTWSGQSTGAMAGSLNMTATGLGAGAYTFTFFDGLCPSNIVSTSISDPNSPAIPTITDALDQPLDPADLTFCEGGSVVLRASTNNNIAWNTTPVQTSRNLTVTQSGTYFVTRTVSGCSSVSLPVTVVVNPIPATPTIIAQGPITFCAGGSVNLAASSGTGVQWSGGAGTNQTITVSNDGTFTVTVTENGCTSASSSPVTVTENPLPPVPTISSSNTSFEFCEGGSLVLTSSAASGNVWNTSASTQSITVNTSGIYFVTRTNNGCSSTSATVTVTEKNQPGAMLPAYNTMCDTLSVFTLNQGVPLNAGIGITESYTVDGTSATTFNPSTVGTYDVVYTVDENGCTASASQTITVIHCPNVGIDENTNNSFVLYPNPTSSIITIDGNDLNQVQQVLVVDALGRTILSQDVNSTTIKVDMSIFENGMYSIIIKGDSFESTKRVQVMK